ncbi:hypothetical protein J1614_006175 [Plenodomus biglobosus]|nr:hypothetical protein J1614_006175 [Plenodomus biglobosus]
MPPGYNLAEAARSKRHQLHGLDEPSAAPQLASLVRKIHTCHNNRYLNPKSTEIQPNLILQTPDMSLEQENRIRSFTSAYPELEIKPLTIEKRSHTSQKTHNVHTKQMTNHAAPSNAKSKPTHSKSLPQNTVSTPTTNPLIIQRPTSSSATHGHWLADTLAAVIPSPLTHKPHTSTQSTPIVPGSPSSTSDNNTQPVPTPHHTATHPHSLHISIPTRISPPPPAVTIQQDRIPASPRLEPTNQQTADASPPLHMRPLIHARSSGQGEAVELLRDGVGGTCIPRYDYFVEGRPLVETICVWREVMHGYRG